MASYDEDAVTMAWEAANDCLHGFDPQEDRWLVSCYHMFSI